MNGIEKVADGNEPMRLLEDGQIIRDTYEVERFLGEGAFAEVYRVRHRFLGRQAMKIFKRTGMSLEDITAMLDEAILLSRIGHPNIVRVFDANILEAKNGPCGYFTMENVSGGSLDQFWRSHRNKTVPTETTLDLMKQLCRGIAQAHRENPPIIHRDIKPQNILVGYEANGLRARVSDFGLAKKVNPLTLLATAAGTMAFKPPEVFTQKRSDSCAGDVWAIGTTFYLLLTGRLPLSIPADVTWNTSHLFETKFPRPSEINPDADAALDEIVLKTLERCPEDRYPTAQELLEALEKWTPQPSGAPLSGRPAAVEKANRPGEKQAEPDGKNGQTLVTQAFAARKEGRLSEAADLMEDAFNQSPDLRAKYAHQVKLWRCGISM